MTNRKTWLFLILVLMLLLTAPAQAHGEVEEQPGPAGPWLVALIYLQLLMVPFVGVWLAKEVWAAWRPRIMTGQIRENRNDDRRE